MKYLGPTKHAVMECVWCKKKFKASFIRNAPTSCCEKHRILHRKRTATLWYAKKRTKVRKYQAAYRARHNSSYVEQDFEQNESLLIR